MLTTRSDHCSCKTSLLNVLLSYKHMHGIRALASFRQITSATYRRYSTMAPVKTQAAAMDFLSFVNASPTPYHAVKSAKERLSKAGFQEIKVGMPELNNGYQWLMQCRRKNPGLQPANQVASTTSHAMARPSSHSPLERNGDQATDWP